MYRGGEGRQYIPADIDTILTDVFVERVEGDNEEYFFGTDEVWPLEPQLPDDFDEADVPHTHPNILDY